MKFQPGHSGNPAGRPPGSLNKKTLALEAAFAAQAEDILNDVVDAAKKGDKDARRMCMERILPRKCDRMVAIDLPVIRTPEDAEAALAVVHAELAAGHLTIKEATALVALVDRMLRVAERIWAFRRARRRGAAWDAVTIDDAESTPNNHKAAQSDAPQADEAAEKPEAPLYSPVNSQIAIDPVSTGASPAEEGGRTRSEVPPPLPRAA